MRRYLPSAVLSLAMIALFGVARGPLHAGVPSSNEEAVPGQQGYKVHISVDLEGIAGVVDSTHTSSGGRNYAAARAQMIAETNAAISAAFDAGAGEVVVVDSHGDKTNLQPARLDRRATLISGGPRPLGMVEGIDESFDAAIFIGYHAQASTADATLDHTYTGQIKGVTPVTLRIEVSDAGQADQVMFVPGMERVGARLVEYAAPDAVAAYRVSRLVRLLAQ